MVNTSIGNGQFHREFIRSDREQISDSGGDFSQIRGLLDENRDSYRLFMGQEGFPGDRNRITYTYSR